jgi:hypothetical protein
MNIRGLIVASICSFLPLSVAFAGARDTGGGDPCEKRIQEIRDDIRDWILKGGPRAGLELEQYSAQMLDFLAVTSEKGVQTERTFIQCVHRPVQVQDNQKVCRFDKDQDGSESRITCFYEAFLDKNTMSEEDQYQLIHHEYAGLAGVEIPQGAQSNYSVSRQIAGRLEERVKKVLAVRPHAPKPPVPRLPQIKAGIYSMSSMFQDCVVQVTGSTPAALSLMIRNSPRSTRDCDAFSLGVIIDRTVPREIADGGITLDVSPGNQNEFTYINTRWPGFKVSAINLGNNMVQLKFYNEGGSIRVRAWEQKEGTILTLAPNPATYLFSDWDTSLTGMSYQENCENAKRYAVEKLMTKCSGFYGTCQVHNVVYSKIRAGGCKADVSVMGKNLLSL